MGLLVAARKMPRSGWGGKLDAIAALHDVSCPSVVRRRSVWPSFRCSISLLLDGKQQVISSALNLVLSTQFSFEGFSLWQAGIFKKKMNFGNSIIYFLAALLEKSTISALHSLCCRCEMVLQCHTPGVACISPGRLVNVHAAMAAAGASTDEERSGLHSAQRGWPEDCSSQLCK